MSQQKIKPNFLYSIISVSLVLFLIGLFLFLILQTNQLVKNFKEQLLVMVEIDRDLDPEQSELLKMQLIKKPYCKHGSLHFSDREDILKEMSESFEEDLLLMDMPNPFYDVYTFNVPATYIQKDSLTNLKNDLGSLEGVTGVYLPELLADKLGLNVQKLSWMSLILILFFSMIALYLIYNTVRLALYANRFLIKNMQLTGATDAFISRPYLLKSLGFGILSAAVALALLWGLVQWVHLQFPDVDTTSNWRLFNVLAFLILILGMLIYVLSTYLVVRKFLRTQESELH